jgi:hypothetical protein
MDYSKEDKARDDALAKAMYEGTTGRGKYATPWTKLPTSVHKHWYKAARIAREALLRQQDDSSEDANENQLALWNNEENDA